MPRKGRETSGTGIYHVMLRGINRQDIFEDSEDYKSQSPQIYGSSTDVSSQWNVLQYHPVYVEKQLRTMIQNSIKNLSL